MTKFQFISLTFVVALGYQTVLAQSGKEKRPETGPDVITTIVATPAEARAIRSLLDVMGETPGGTQQTEKALDGGIAAYRKGLPGLPEPVWTALTPELKRHFAPPELPQPSTPI